MHESAAVDPPRCSRGIDGFIILAGIEMFSHAAEDGAGGTEDGADAGQGGVAEGNQRRKGVEGEVREGVRRGEGATQTEVRSGPKG